MVRYNYSIPKIFMGTAISPIYAKIEYDITTAFPQDFWEWLSDSRSQKAYGNICCVSYSYKNCGNDCYISSAHKAFSKAGLIKNISLKVWNLFFFLSYIHANPYIFINAVD